MAPQVVGCLRKISWPIQARWTILSRTEQLPVDVQLVGEDLVAADVRAGRDRHQAIRAGQTSGGQNPSTISVWVVVPLQDRWEEFLREYAMNPYSPVPLPDSLLTAFRAAPTGHRGSATP
jgi:hypothetical protein